MMKVKKAICGLLMTGIFLTSCHFMEQQKNTEKSKTHKKQSTKEKSKQKEPVDLNKPVAIYRANEKDEATNNDFLVKVFPTKDSEEFKVVINFGENRAQDNVKFPNPKYYRKVALRKSDTANACLIGFIGKKGKFNEMKEISGSSSQIKITSLKAYYFKTE